EWAMVLQPCVQIERGWMSRGRAVDSTRRRCFFFDEIAECRGIGAFFSSFFSSCTALEARLVYKVGQSGAGAPHSKDPLKFTSVRRRLPPLSLHMNCRQRVCR